MTERPVILDITRLLTRLGRATPNGIDRVDLAYAQHYLAPSRLGQGALFGYRGIPRLIDGPSARAVVEAIAAGWREDAEDDCAADLSGLIDTHPGTQAAKRQAKTHTLSSAAQRCGRLAQSFVRFRSHGRIFGATGLFPARDMVRHAPKNAIFLNISQFPIWRPGYLDWLDARPDIRPVFFLHDLLPVQFPEFFREFEVRRHTGRLRSIARRAAGVIVASEATRQAFEAYFRASDISAPPMLVAPLPVASAFLRPLEAAPPSTQVPYFVCVGTLEPRKNHLFLLQIWRELSRRLGPSTPRLILVGARGWDNENVIDMLERCDALQGVVIEARGLPTPALRRLLAGCKALLMPTFAEGFGLPVAEALASGTTVIASDISVFRTLADDRLTLIDPLDGEQWLCAIAHAIDPHCTGNVHRANFSSNTDTLYHFDHTDAFFGRLP